MVGTVSLLGGLALSGFMSTPVAAALTITFLMLSINCYLATYTLGRFQISFGAFSPTELRILLAVGNAALLWKPNVTLFGRELRLFDVGGVIAIGGMLAILVVSIARNTVQLYRDEPIA
jgi:hypothetical protein